ncbi:MULTISPECIES: ABC transporter permease [Thermoactinomyces]|jgi:peptide/nickel transport system permease protein|uniref:ABC transporter permease n=1 Tax=Thermoactinomyces daqus TaxID=1329516 RepID=A0A7W1X7I2_9BACL|nr:MULTISPECIES: ABC transporter permease [Thermoactinomyces]MBA4541478.1 ABC transporter permease [Thermoactinomyces daqus]MBH8596954.1 ABC transporter permease [Thermoactinomyces sp. CICC 10523]MBH8603730.1 ABC transporter permease [Thermoactinomyces sp. CICC 10522]MBH8607635.1 ABC transporter permease [Thermoactinomyces sp. CICC 10521]
MAIIIRRLLLAIPVVFLVTLMVFSLMHMLPGDPATVILGQEATPEAVAALRAELGLNKPLPVQYFDWLSGVLHGNLGNSLVDHTPVAQLIMERLPATIELTLGTFIVATLIAVPAGILSAVRPRSLTDYSGTLFALCGMSVPHFWLGMMLIILFAVKLGWVPASGYVPFFDDPLGNLSAMILPIIATGLRESAVLMRMMRSSLLEALQADYIRTAYAKGLKERLVILRHALKNALVPVVTTSGLVVAGLLGGLVITESIFSIPGFGKLIVDSIFNRDFVTVQGAVLVSALLIVLINLLVDILHFIIDPRIKSGKEVG